LIRWVGGHHLLNFMKRKEANGNKACERRGDNPHQPGNVVHTILLFPLLMEK